MSMYSHRGMGAVPPGNSARLNELLDQIRAEFETQLRQTEGFEHQSELCNAGFAIQWQNLFTNVSVCNYIVSAQVSEMQLVREKVYAMEQTHMTLKQK